MKFSPGAVFAGAVLAPAILWPLWQPLMRSHGPAVLPDPFPEAEFVPAAVTPSDDAPSVPRLACPGCEDLQRLSRRLREREEGAARRLEAASGRLSASSPHETVRSRLEIALRRARDDKRGAAAFRTAVIEALKVCEGGPGCAESSLAAAWDENCPPEHPDLGRETRTLAALAGVLARKAGACARAACADVTCAHLAHSSGQLAAADRVLERLAGPPGTDAESALAVDGDAPATAAGLLREAEDWRNRIPALFNGGSDPSAQFAASSEAALSLAAKLTGARRPGGAAHDPLWRLNVLSLRLETMARVLDALAEAARSGNGGRDAIMLAARQQAAAAFRELLIAQMRLRAAAEQTAPAGASVARRCDRRRRAEIARARGQIRALRAALHRCARRVACRVGVRPAPEPAPGLDPVSAWRLALDRTLIELSGAAHDLAVTAQKPVVIETDRARYQSGEAVAARLNSRATACMAVEGSWAGLFAAGAPRLRAAEAGAVALRRLSLRGRPWEEVFFEAPRPGVYEVRTYASLRRGGAMTGRVRFDVVPRPEGCSGFTGTWKTNFGRLQITVRGDEASGSYRRGDGWRAGFLTGQVSGRILMGEWRSELGGGGTRLVLSEDGKTFSGTWSQFRDAFAGTGVWKGSCDGPARPRSDKGRDVN